MLRDKHCPECRWVPVVDDSGRRRLEMRWDQPIAAPAASSLAKAA
ncbi:hypothetical protein [Candidatus Blastococcus massiliensis]|nr:hypothetical protein [Candidatus Blastococcus massiliensis]